MRQGILQKPEIIPPGLTLDRSDEFFLILKREYRIGCFISYLTERQRNPPAFKLVIFFILVIFLVEGHAYKVSYVHEVIKLECLGQQKARALFDL